MNTKQLILLLVTISLSSTLSSKMPPDGLSSLMKGILLTKNPDQLEQMKTLIPQPSTTNKRNAITQAGVPKAVRRSEVMPNKMMIQNVNEVMIPRNVAPQRTAPAKAIVRKPNEVVMPMNMALHKPSELASPKNILIKKPELAMPNKVLARNPEVAVPNRRILVQKAEEIPFLKNLLLQNGNAGINKGALPKTKVVKASDVPLKTPPQVVRSIPERNSSQRVVVIQPNIAEYITQEKLTSKPISPVATSVKTLSVPISSLINMPVSRGQFLRKIPIPPPTI